jgi:hypothetical protein
LSFFTTWSLKLSPVRSYVVKRLSQAKHWRRRRITRPESLERESTTLSLSSLQKGHLTTQVDLLESDPLESMQRSTSVVLHKQLLYIC